MTRITSKSWQDLQLQDLFYAYRKTKADCFFQTFDLHRAAVRRLRDPVTRKFGFLDDIQPGGLQTRTRTYTAPFALTSRETDHRIAWDFCAKQNTGDIQ